MKKVIITLLLVFCSTMLFSEDLIASVTPELIGINTELPNLLKEAAERAGLNLTVIEQPTGRSLENFKTGEHHIEMRIPSFAQQFDFVTAIPVPVSKLTIKVFVNKNSGIREIKDLSGKKFTSIHGLALNDVIIAQIPDLELNLLRDFSAVSKYVAAGRSDFFIQEEFAGVDLLKTTKTESDISVLDENILEIPLFVFVHNNKAHVVDSLKPVLEQMVQEGKFD